MTSPRWWPTGGFGLICTGVLLMLAPLHYRAGERGKVAVDLFFAVFFLGRAVMLRWEEVRRG